MVDKFSSRITDMNSEYGTCAICYASIVIYLGTLTSRTVTKLFEVQPTYVVSKDIMTNSGATIFCQSSQQCWVLSSKNKINSKDLRDHVNWILKKIEPRAIIAFHYLQQREDVKMKMHCTWFSREESWMGGGPVLWPEQLEIIADLNLELAFNVFFGFGDDQQIA